MKKICVQYLNNPQNVQLCVLVMTFLSVANKLKLEEMTNSSDVKTMKHGFKEHKENIK